MSELHIDAEGDTAIVSGEVDVSNSAVLKRSLTQAAVSLVDLTGSGQRRRKSLGFEPGGQAKLGSMTEGADLGAHDVRCRRSASRSTDA